MSPARARLLVHPIDTDFQSFGELLGCQNVFRFECARRVHMHQPCTALSKSLIPQTKNMNSRYLIGVSSRNGLRPPDGSDTLKSFHFAGKQMELRTAA